MGGSGGFHRLYDDHPTVVYPSQTKYVVHCYLGYHLLSIITHLVSIPRSDFMEMLLHHTMTIMLAHGSYMGNYQGPTIIILTLHNWSDFFIASSRSFVDLNTPMTVVSYICLLVTWIWGRIYIFGSFIYEHTMLEEKPSLQG
jgi:hypothetical protein